MSKPTHDCAELLSVISRTAADLLNTLLIYSAAVLIVLAAPSGCLQVHTRSADSSPNAPIFISKLKFILGRKKRAEMNKFMNSVCVFDDQLSSLFVVLSR